ncbi:MAG: ABC transporter substrate-binding protein [Clostridiaceae bacterium]
MKTKKLLSFITAAALLITSVTGCSSKTSSEDVKEIKIGAMLPLTGDIATFGQSAKNALELLTEQVNKEGGIDGKTVKFVYQDDENKPASSANVTQKLINDEKVVALVGSIGSTCSIADGPIATENKIPMVTPTSTNPKVTTEGGEYVFRACFIDPFQGTVLAKFASEDLKATTAAILYDVANDYSKGLAEYFKANFEKAGGKVVAYETYNTGDQDFNAQLTKIKSLNPQVLLIPDYYQTVGIIAKQARTAGITATFLGGDGWDSPELFTIGGDAVNKGYFSNHYSPDDKAKEVQDFISAYKAKYNTTPDALAALSYDAGKILLDAIDKADSLDGVKIIEALKATNGTFVSGSVTYDKDRNPVKGAVIIKTENGKQVFEKKVNP